MLQPPFTIGTGHHLPVDPAVPHRLEPQFARLGPDLFAADAALGLRRDALCLHFAADAAGVNLPEVGLVGASTRSTRIGELDGPTVRGRVRAIIDRLRNPAAYPNVTCGTSVWLKSTSA